MEYDDPERGTEAYTMGVGAEYKVKVLGCGPQSTGPDQLGLITGKTFFRSGVESNQKNESCRTNRRSRRHATLKLSPVLLLNLDVNLSETGQDLPTLRHLWRSQPRATVANHFLKCKEGGKVV